MMRRFCGIGILLPLLLLSCGGRKEEYKGNPAVELELVKVTDVSVDVRIRTIFTDAVCLAVRPARDGAPSIQDLLEDGTRVAGEHASFNGLTPSRNYVLYAVAVQNGRTGTLESLPFRTEDHFPDLFAWEVGREIPVPADLTLVTRGQHNANPPRWTPERFRSHVTWTDAEGQERWLFEAFLCIEGYDGKRGLTFSIHPSAWSATQESWNELLDYWFDPADGALKTLDEAVGAATKRIGPPPSRRQVVMALPDPIMLEHFADKNSSTTYWGALDGRTLDFSDVDDQVLAYCWYADECRRRFYRLNPANLELAGFYVLSEELVAKPSGWNYAYKRWDVILKAASTHFHRCNEGLWWIPYYQAPGVDLWQSLGIDMACMQPNHYWDTDNQHPMARAITTIQRYGMGIELEFEYSMVKEVMSEPGKMGPDGSGHMTFTVDDVPALRDRFREYMTAYEAAGLYGKKPIALYSGTDAMHQLATSSDPDDRTIYQELCRYITDSPLRK